MQDPPPAGQGSGVAETGEDHQIDRATHRLSPLAEFRREGSVLLGQGEGFESLQTLMHQIERVVDQLGGLVGGHGGSDAGVQTPGLSEGRQSALWN